MQKPRAAVLLLGYNDKQNLQDSLSSILAQTYEHFSVFYIDNASNDGSLDFVRTYFPAVETIGNTENLGYAGGYAKILPEIFSQNFDCAVLVNSDVVVDSNWLEELITSAYADTKIGIAQSKIYLWENGKTMKINSWGNVVHFTGLGFSGGFQLHDKPDDFKDRPIPYASGCSMLIKKETFSDIGNIDEKFFLYLEDQDWGWRARMFGWDIMLSPKSKIWHKYKFDSTRTAKFFYLERNRYFFITKNFKLKTIILIFPALLALEIGILAHSLAHGYFGLKIKAYGAFLASLGQLARQRKNVQQRRKLSDSELFSYLSPTIEFEDLNSPLLTMANQFFTWYYKIIKKII